MLLTWAFFICQCYSLIVTQSTRVNDMKKLLLAAALAVSSAATQAATLSYTNEFSGSGDTLSAPVLISYTNSMYGGDTAVQIDFDLMALNSTEKLTGLYLNAADDLLLANAVAQPPGDAEANNFDLGINSFRPDGDGYFDYLIEFPNNAPGSLSGGEYFTLYLLGVSLSDLAALSLPGPGASSPGPFLTAIKMQGLGLNGGGSGWFNNSGIGVDPFVEPNVVPLPAAAWMFLGGLGLFRVLRGKKA